MVRGGRGHGRKAIPLEGEPMNHQARPEQLSVQGRKATGLICIHRLIQSPRGVRLGHFSAITLATARTDTGSHLRGDCQVHHGGRHRWAAMQEGTMEGSPPPGTSHPLCSLSLVTEVWDSGLRCQREREARKSRKQTSWLAATRHRA